MDDKTNSIFELGALDFAFWMKLDLHKNDLKNKWH